MGSCRYEDGRVYVGLFERGKAHGQKLADSHQGDLRTALRPCCMPCSVCRTTCLTTSFFPFGNYDSHIRVIIAHAEPLRKSIHCLHQYTSPFATLTSVLFFYKEGPYISTQHRSKHRRGSPFTGSPHHHLVRIEIITSILVLIVSSLL
jgi:hypothetical protein